MAVTWEYDPVRITLHVFLCSLENGVHETREVQDWRWIDLSELDHYNFAKVDQRVIWRISELDYIFKKGVSYGIREF